MVISKVMEGNLIKYPQRVVRLMTCFTLSVILFKCMFTVNYLTFCFCPDHKVFGIEHPYFKESRQVRSNIFSVVMPAFWNKVPPTPPNPDDSHAVDIPEILKDLAVLPDFGVGWIEPRC